MCGAQAAAAASAAEESAIMAAKHAHEANTANARAAAISAAQSYNLVRPGPLHLQMSPINFLSFQALVFHCEIDFHLFFVSCEAGLIGACSVCMLFPSST